MKTNEYDEEVVIEAATAVIENLMKFTPQKDIDKLMALYDDSEEFQLIDNEGGKNIEQLKKCIKGCLAV